jgi:hypothetical protein
MYLYGMSIGFYVFSDDSDIHSTIIRENKELRCTDESSFVFCDTVVAMRCMGDL